MASLKSTLWAVYRPEHKELTYHISGTDMSTHGWIKVRDFEVQYEPPAASTYIPALVPALREKRSALMAKHQMELNDLDDAIQNLLCIEGGL